MNHHTQKFLHVVSVWTFSLLSLFSAGCATDRQVISQANQMHGSLRPAVMTDPQLAGYLQEVGDRIIDAAKEASQQRSGGGEDRSWMFSKNMKFHFVNSKTLNAFTTGGEHMYIYTALLQATKNEDELAAVMAHEFAHIYGRHVQGGMNRQYGILAAAAAAGGAGYLLGGDEKGNQYAGLGAGAAMLAGQFVGMGWTRKDEEEADKLGFAFYTHAGWDPDRFGDFFATMIKMGGDQGPEMLSDHPSLSSRVADAKERADKLPPQAEQWRRPPVADESEFARIKARAAEVGKEMPDDTSLEQSQELLAALPRSCLTPAVQPDQQRAEQRVMTKLKAEEEGEGAAPAKRRTRAQRARDRERQ